MREEERKGAGKEGTGEVREENLLQFKLSYKPLVGKDDFDELFNNSSQKISSENFDLLNANFSWCKTDLQGNF